jgi:hypothetical protein
MATISDSFSTGSQRIAVVFVDEMEHVHSTPSCEHVTGEIRMFSEHPGEPFFNFVCPCIDVEIHPVDPRFSGPNVDAPATSGSPGAQTATLPPWPADLDQPSAYPFGSAQEVSLWLSQIGRKLEATDIIAIPNLKIWAKSYVMDSKNHSMDDGSPNTFIESVANACARYDITAGQTKGVLNWWRAQIKRGKNQEVSGNLTVTIIPDSGIDLRDLPSGRYAVPGGDTRLKLRVNHTKYNYTYVNDAAVYGQGKKYGVQKPSEMYIGDVQDELKAIMADPKAAIAEYGFLTGKCGICNRPLEDQVSIKNGIGPICAKKIGF